MDWGTLIVISIHAPLAGCDKNKKNIKKRLTNKFQSTHPLRGATFARRRNDDEGEFQSTHPLRGATAETSAGRTRRGISIHAPLAGCDQMTLSLISPSMTFQSTHPLRGATCHELKMTCPTNISIHAPLAGCDINNIQIFGADAISIHAPLAGCDVFVRTVTAKCVNFNPRTPCGVRRGQQDLRERVDDFNPRTPCGVRPAPQASRACGKGFQSTHPLRGATRGKQDLRERVDNFNPRTPCGVRQLAKTLMWSPLYFNPRTPCGVRPTFDIRACISLIFQSTHPLRGATPLWRG